jgi:hypothetical protein
MKLSAAIDGKTLREKLSKEYQILMPRLLDNNEMLVAVNETVLYQSAEYVIGAFRKLV